MTVLENKVKATIFLENTFGLPVARQVWLFKYGVEDKYYKPKLIVHYIPKGKRKKVGYKLEKAVIVEGWQEIDGAINNNKDGEWLSFDDEKFNDIVSKLNNVIIKNF